MNARRVISASVVGTILGTCLVAGAAAPASAAGCVSPGEFSKAKTGMSVSQVARLFGTNGRVMTKSSGYGNTIVIRDYDACTQFGAVSMLFENGRLSTKSAVF